MILLSGVYAGVMFLLDGPLDTVSCLKGLTPSRVGSGQTTCPVNEEAYCTAYTARMRRSAALDISAHVLLIGESMPEFRTGRDALK